MADKVHITYGLPGSGKTYFCSQETKGRKDRYYLSMDYHVQRNLVLFGRVKQLEDWLPAVLSGVLKERYSEVYIDGLCTTHKVLADIVSYIGESASGCRIIIHVWDCDRETCMVNDIGRRNRDSKITIENMPYEPIKDIDELMGLIYEWDRGKFTFSIERHAVIRKPDWKIYFADAGICASEYDSKYDSHTYIYDDGKGRFRDSRLWESSAWSLGGTCGSYTGDVTAISGDTETPINEVYDMFEAACPGIPLRLARKLMEQCVEIVEKTNGDYYGGHITEARYVVNLEKMYCIIQEDND